MVITKEDPDRRDLLFLQNRSRNPQNNTWTCQRGQKPDFVDFPTVIALNLNNVSSMKTVHCGRILLSLFLIASPGDAEDKRLIHSVGYRQHKVN